MPIWLCCALSAVIGYLLGCLSPAYILSRSKGVDIRKKGTGNLGASNAMLLFGWRWGILVALLDIGKAALAVWLCSRLFPEVPVCRVIAGAGSVLGHLFPFYLRFRGGKGLAAYYGVILALSWRYALILAVAAALLVLLTDYMVAATVSVVGSAPIYCLWTRHWAAAAILGALTLLILWLHRVNFVRILQGTEVGLRKANRGELRINKK